LTSIKNPNTPKFNQSNVAIAKAAALANIENMPESVLEDAKIAEAKKKTTKIYANIEHEKGIEEGKEEMILEMYAAQMPIDQIAKIAKKTTAEISAIIEKHRK
jgi:hypothetical protein